MSMTALQLRPGLMIEYNKELWQCLEAVHKTPGNKRGFIQAKLRNLRTGLQMEHKFSSTENLERVSLRSREMQFLYKEGDFYHFMDLENFEQIQLDKQLLGNSVDYLLSEAKVKVSFHDEAPLGLELPQTMDFKVVDAEPNLKTATATAAYKNCTIETGINVKVPPFVEAGEVITVNTESGEYVGRAKN